uniref:Aminoacyl-histidine dipeptidase, putative n=1 Tax=Entamoeba invadens TaxID=33085 RepID=S0B3N6_ENTIV|nr:aminoacyl-histidine dipeptidase, putative [Entamoeba invadens]
MEPEKLFKYPHSLDMYNQLAALCKDEGSKVYWKWFLALSEVPRRSGNRLPPSEWLISIIKMQGLEYKVDKERNIVCYVPASKGFEEKPSICIQGHYDMVGTVAAGVGHDFDKDPIKMKLEGNILSAQGTTLGGDDGTGVACGLAYIELRDKFQHPALECLFTADEEIGCLGASGLVTGEMLTDKCKYLINVDSEDWGEVTISSAGTAFRVGSVPVKYQEVPAGFKGIEITIEKFRGGHSGVDIQHQRANALKWVTDVIIHAQSLLRVNGNQYHIVSFQAGHAHNAIPSHAKVTIAVKECIADKVIEEIKANHEALTTLSLGTQPNKPELVMKKVDIAAGTQVLNYVSTCNCLQLIEKLPHGVVKFSNDVEGLVETSQSVAIGKLDGDFFKVTIFARSSKDEDMLDLVKADGLIFKCHGATMVKAVDDACGWPADPNSHLLATLKDCYHKMFGGEMKTVAIHAGLENSIIMEKYKGLNLQSVSLGPSVIDVHTDKEHVFVDTASKLYALVIDVMEKI